MPVHHCILRAGYIFASFTHLQMERNSGPGWIIPGVSPRRDVEDVDGVTSQLMFNVRLCRSE